MKNKSILSLLIIWISLYGSVAQSGITSSKLNCFGFSDKSQHNHQDFNHLKPIEIYQKLHNENLFHIAGLGSGVYGLTYLSTRYLNKTKKTGTIRSRRRRSYKIKVDTDEKYVVKEENTRSVECRLDSDPIFEREARIMSQLKDSSLMLELIAFGQKEDGSLFIITPFMGTDLESACHKKIIPSGSSFLKKFHQFLFKAQQQLMEAGVSYLDWKPDNIVYQKKSGQHQFTLIDFGLANQFDESQESEVQAGNLMTAAPEVFYQFQGSYQVSMANSFSIGATAIVFNEYLKEEYAKIPSIQKSESGNPDPQSYQNYLNYLWSVKNVPEYIYDLITENPEHRLHFDLKSKLWIKLDNEDKTNKTVYKIFDPDRLEYTSHRSNII